MTPDKVVLPIQAVMDCLEACYFANEHPYPMGLAFRQAVNLLQDYQKLREKIDREKIESIINDNCRYIVDEGKVMFIYGNTAQAIVTYLQQPTEH